MVRLATPDAGVHPVRQREAMKRGRRDGSRTLVWFRGKDLRVADHAPLADAVAGGDVIPLFVLDPYFFAPPRARRAPHRVQFLLESLAALAASIQQRGSRLLVVPGKSVAVVPRLARAWRVDRVVAYSWVAPVGRARDRLVAARLRVPFDLYDGETLVTPGSLRSGAGSPYVVYTAFARAFHRAALIGAPRPAPRRLPPLPLDVGAGTVAIPSLDSLGVTRNRRVLRLGEAAARLRLRRFLNGRVAAAIAHHERQAALFAEQKLDPRQLDSTRIYRGPIDQVLAKAAQFRRAA